jgi:hypothetical protein
MAKFITILLLLSTFFVSSTNAATTPSVADSLFSLNATTIKIQDLAVMKMRDVEKISGKKLSLKEKLAFKILQWKLKKELTHEGKDKTDKGKTAMILGIIGIASLFIPYLVVVSIPCTVLALVFGYQAKRANPDDSKARTAIILGWVTTGLYVLAIALILVLIAAWDWGW